MLLIYLYHGDLYSDVSKSDQYFRPACHIVLTLLAQWSIFTRGHGGYVSVPNQS